jgi:Tol biopolymer transport system component
VHQPTWHPRVEDLPQFEENGDTMSLSPDGEWVAFASDRLQRDVFHGYVTSRRTGETVPIFADSPDVLGLSWSRDGRAIYAHAGGHMVRQRVSGTPPVPQGPREDLGSGGDLCECGSDQLITSLYATGWHVVLRTASGEQQLFVTEPQAAVTGASCDPSGEHIVVVAGRHWGEAGNDVYLLDRRGNVQRLTDDHVTEGATFTADGRGLIVSRAIDHHEQLFELQLDRPHELHRLLVDGERDMRPTVSPDGRVLGFVRDDTSFFPTIYRGNEEERFITREKGTFWFVRGVTDDLAVAQFSAHDAWQVVALHVATGEVTRLAAGSAPFPSRDGRTVYFAGNDARDTLFAVPLSGGTPVAVAKLPGPIVIGDAGPDGLHVAVERATLERDAFRIIDGAVQPENAPGLVTVAPDGGWRAVTVRKSVVKAELLLVPPGAPLDQPRARLPIASGYNRWLDNHRIGYCADDACRIYDVTTDAPTDVAHSTGMALMSSFAPDGVHILSSQTVGHVTRHVIANFGDR